MVCLAYQDVTRRVDLSVLQLFERLVTKVFPIVVRAVLGIGLHG